MKLFKIPEISLPPCKELKYFTLEFAKQEIKVDIIGLQETWRLNTLSYSIYLDFRRKKVLKYTRTVIMVVASVFIYRRYLMDSTLKRILT